MAVVKEVNWLELPEDFTVLVTDKLSRCDFIRFGAVCTYWKSIIVSDKCRRCRSVLHQLPLLLRACSKDTFDIHNIYECIEKRTYNFQVFVPHAERTLGSSHGWVVTKWIEDADEALTIFLTNPFSDNTIKLPLMRRGIRVEDVDKVVLSANPTSNPNYVVMVIFRRGGRLAFYNPSPGKDDWTYEKSTLISFDDALYYRDEFYLVDSFGSLFTYDYNHPDHLGLSPELAPSPYSTIELADGDKDKNHFLAKLSSGDLILVKRSRKSTRLPMGMDFTYYTHGFSVHKMNQVEHKWMEVQDLCGDALFLDDWKSSSVRASDFLGCKPNCIYFIDGGLGHFTEDGVPSKTEHIGIFNMEDGSIEQQTPPVFRSKLGAAYPIWIEPMP